MQDVAHAARVRPVPAVQELGPGELELCAYVAHRRSIYNFIKGIREKHGAATEFGGYEYHLIGCIGECATAKYLNLYWTGSELGDVRQIDVGGCIQVRATDTNGHRLRLHDSDSDVLPFVLAYVISSSLPRVGLMGWLRAKAGKRKEYWTDPGTGRPAYFVPNEMLEAMTDLRV
jgi:hypothetical protein